MSQTPRDQGPADDPADERATRPTSASSSSSLARSSVVMASGTLVSRVLGMVRVVLLAGVLGTLSPTSAANVWDTANTIPNTIYLLLAAGVLNVLLLPQLTRAMTRGREGQDYTDRLITLSLAILVGGTVLFVLAAPLITKVYALDWAWDDPKLQLATMFAYLCIPQMLFYGVHTLLGQVLAAHHRFAAFMWSPALANVIAITGIVIFARRYPDAGVIPLEDWTGGMIWLLAGSATLGIAVQALVLLPAVRATGFRWHVRWGFRGVGLATATTMAGWALADVAVSQGGMLVVTNLLNAAADEMRLAPGRFAYTQAFSVFVLPHSIIALSLLTAIYPVLAKDAARDDTRSMAEHTGRGLRLLGAAMIPIATGMLLLAPLLVRVIYVGSAPAEHRAVAGILTLMVLGLVPYGVYLLCARVFYSFEDARTPFFFQVSITAVLLLVCAVAAFSPAPRVAMLLGLGQALGQTTAACFGLAAVRRRLPELALRPVATAYLRSVVAALAALVPAWLVIRLLDRGAPPDPGSMQRASAEAFLSGAVALGVSGVVFLLGYAVLAHLLGVREVTEVAAPVIRRVPGLRRFAPTAPVDLATGDRLEPDPDTDHEPVAVETVEDSDEASTLTGLEPVVASTAPDAAGGAASPDERAGRSTLGWDDGRQAQAEESNSMDRLEVGTRLGDRYALDELLAERDGGGLQYWSARDATLGRLVAVTVLPSDGEWSDTAEAVLDGARRVASVDDPRLVRVLDVGNNDDASLCWIIEEGLSEAESLASLVEEHPLPAEEARRIVGESAAALESARRRGLHHLYLNPHSVLRTTDGTVKVSGVGVASALEGTDDVTPDEASLIDAADLISLLYTGLTGRWPGEDLAGVRPARRLADGSLPAPSELVAGVPGDLDALCRLAHGVDADLHRTPHTPGELARQLSPWSSEMVRADRPGELSAPRSRSGADHGRAGAALSGAAGASAAATAAHPTHADDAAPTSGDATEQVPQPYYRTDGRASDAGRGARPVREDDTMGGLLRSGEARETRVEQARADHARPAASAAAGGRAGATGRGSGAMGGGSGGDGLPEDRGTGAQTVVVMIITLALLGVAVFLGWGVLRGLGGDDDAAPGGDPSASAPADPAGATGGDDGQTASAAPEGDGGDEGAEEEATEDSAPAPAPAEGSGVGVLGITSYDPQGDGDENNADTPLAVDGDPETSWSSHTYLTPGWGSLKNGTGLILDLGEGASVSEVAVELGPGDVAATLYLSDAATIDGATELGSSDDAADTWTVTPDEAATGRYLILWFTRAATTDDGERVGVREISIR